MKKTIAITSALAAASSLATAEIKINEFLSFAGFVDASYSNTDAEFGVNENGDNSFGIDQVEIDWMFNFGKVTAQVDLEYEEGTDSTEVEQAFVNFDLGNGLVVTTGRYESVLGLEAKEPTGLYQYSTAYDFGAAGTVGLGDQNINPQYGQGVKLTKTSGDNVYSLSIQDESFEEDADRLGGSGDSSYSIEGGASIALSDELTWFIGGATEDADAGDSYVINSHLTYASGAWTYGAEVSYGESDVIGDSINSNIVDTVEAVAVADFGIDDNDTFFIADQQSGNSETLQALIMANYAYSDCCSVTARISYHDSDRDVAGGLNAQISATPVAEIPFEESLNIEVFKYTLAHNYAVTDNLAIITEVSYVDGEASVAGGTADIEALTGAVEVLFTF